MIADRLILVLALALGRAWGQAPTMEGLNGMVGQLKPPPPKKRPRIYEDGKAAQAFTPELVSEVAPFALSQEEIDQVNKEVPAPDSSLGRKLSAIMNRAYLGGTTPEAFRGSSLRVLTWNLNAPHTQKAIDAIVAVADDSPEGVGRALGRKKPIGEKASREMGEIAQTDVFLIQEVPLPTAVLLAKHLGCMVFWAPEFIEVGDNAKGRDPQAGWDFTGNAILSRVQLSDLKVLRFAHQADWYYRQKGAQPLGDRLTQLAAKVLFAADFGSPHQTRPPAPYGGRLALFAKADAGRFVWVADLHLEDLAGAHASGPDLRHAQWNEARAFISSIKEPMIFGGDFNTMGDSVGVGEGEDIATEVPNAMHSAQPPVDRQTGLAPGVGNKFTGVIDSGNLVTTLTHSPGSRKGLVARQAASLAVDVVPYGPTVKDGIGAVKKIKDHPSVGKAILYGGEVAADFFPYSAPAAKGFEVYRDEKARHDPSSRFNADHKLFNDIKHELDARPLNPRTGFRFGVGGYQSTWSSGRPMGLVDTVVDWLFLNDPSHELKAPKGKVLKALVKDTRGGRSIDDQLSDHYPLRAEIPLPR